MTDRAKEALDKLIDSIADVEEHDETLATIREELDAADNAEGSWKDKYDKLSAKYKERFKEDISTPPTSQAGREEKKEESKKTEEVKVEDLDFSAKTE